MFNEVVELCKERPELEKMIRNRVYLCMQVGNEWNTRRFDYAFDEVSAKTKLLEHIKELEQTYKIKYSEYDDVYMVFIREVRYDLMEYKEIECYELNEDTMKFEEE